MTTIIMITTMIMDQTSHIPMLDDFLFRAALAALGVALAAGPLGCFVVWRRMAYFGDATAHAALLGVAFSLALDMPIFLGVLAICLVIAVSVTKLNAQGVALDTGLGVLSHASLGAGLVAVSFLAGVRVDLDSFLFGDILTVSKTDLLVIWGAAALILALLAFRWNKLLITTLSPDLAHSYNIDPRREQLILTLVLALTVAITLKIIGALLIGALLIIPAAASRPLVRSPESMAVVAAALASVAALGGIAASYQWNTPTGPMIISTAALIFAVSTLIGLKKRT